MLLQVMRHIHNFFEVSDESGNFTITGGIIALKGKYITGQYIAVTGSVLNDGVYLLTNTLYTLSQAQDEAFNGIVYGLRIPRDFLSLVSDIEQFVAKAGADSPYTSESVVGLHSWSKATDKTGAPVSWETVYKKRLNPYRRMFSSIKI